MQTLIIEDEDSSYDVLERLIQRCAPQLNVLGRAKSVEQALALIKEFTPELVFMDIDLPDGTGFDIIQKLKPVDFSIIFVTAYNQYAVQAFRFSATDFLLKPLNEDEFKEALEKVASSERQKNYNLRLDVLLANLQAQMIDGKKIILKTLEDIFIVSVKDIVSVQSDGAYSQFYLLSGKRITVSTNLKKYEEMLFDQGFFRSHQCHLVNLMHVERFHKLDGGMLIMKNGASVPVSSRRKEALLEVLNSIA